MVAGSSVALAKDNAVAEPGYGTPFYVGDVLAVSTGEDGHLKTLTVHYRMPVGGDGLFCDDSRKPWDSGRSRPSAECALAVDGRLRRSRPK